MALELTLAGPLSRPSRVPPGAGHRERWAGKIRSQSGHGRSKVVVLVREVVWVTAVHPASCGGW
jgi:hypothetical protein